MRARHRRAAVACAAAGAALWTAGCGGREMPTSPARLLDGSRAPSLPKPLALAARHATRSRLRLLRAGALDARARACVDGFRSEFRIPGATMVVERTGVRDASLTFTDAGHHVVLGCDRTGRPDATGPWCARSVGRLYAGILRDGRVDIQCVDPGGAPVGFVWLEPTPGVRWIVVGKGSAAEVQDMAAGLPVRISTGEVDATDSSATFAVTEYDTRGRQVDRYRLGVRVAG